MNISTLGISGRLTEIEIRLDLEYFKFNGTRL